MRVSVKDFQSLKNVALTIEGFTVLLGPSDVGKSALVRAISSALFNRPGNAFVRTGETSAEVALAGAPSTTEPLDVVWTKGKNPAVYVVRGQTYKKVGKGTPDLVEQAGYRVVELRDAELRPQIAGQADRLFLLHESGSTLVDALAAASRLDIFSDAIEACASDLRVAEVALKGATGMAEAFEAGLGRVQEEATAWLARVKPLAERVFDLGERKIKLAKVAQAALEVSRVLKQPPPIPSIPDLGRWRSTMMAGKTALYGRRVSAPLPIPALPDNSRVRALLAAKVTLRQAANDVLLTGQTMRNRALLLTKVEQELKQFYLDHPRCPTCGGEWVPDGSSSTGKDQAASLASSPRPDAGARS